MPEQFGPLTRILGDPEVTDVFVNAAGDVWLVRGCGLEPLRALRLDPAEVRRLATRLIALAGRHLDEASPCADVRLADGLRVHAILPPVARAGTVLSIRAPRVEILGLDALDDGFFFERVGRDEVEALVDRRANVLITGATGTGKTTLLAALLGRASPTERIVTIEDTAELRVDHPHVVALETRQANLEGAGRVDLARLVREALRMRPDRLVVGECRGEEVRELLSALSTGHDGGAGTLHANGLDAVPARLEALGALAGMSPESLARQVVSAFDAVLHLESATDGGERSRRRIAGLASFGLDPAERLRIRDGR